MMQHQQASFISLTWQANDNTMMAKVDRDRKKNFSEHVDYNW